MQILSEAIRHVPYYAELARSAGCAADDIRLAEDVRRFPVIRAHDYREAASQNGKAFVLDPRLGGRCVDVQHTSGTAGQPLYLRRTAWERAINSAHTVRFLRRSGIRPFDRTLAFVTLDRVVEGDSILQQLGLYRRTALSFDVPIEQVVDLVVEREINCVYGARSHVELLAGELARRADRPRFRTALIGAEVITDRSREAIRRGLQPEIFGEWYGTSEFGVVAHRLGDRYRVMPRTVHARLEEAGPDQDGFGRPVLSSLFMRAQPVVNYAVGDRLLGPRLDAAGRIESFDSVVGRDNDYLVSLSGERWGASRLYTLLETPPAVQRFRIEQHAPGEIVFSIVVAEGHVDSTLQELGALLARVLRDAFRYRIAVVPEIAPMPSGKLAVVRRLFDEAPARSADDRAGEVGEGPGAVKNGPGGNDRPGDPEDGPKRQGEPGAEDEPPR